MNHHFEELIKGHITPEEYERRLSLPKWIKVGNRIVGIAEYEGKNLRGKKGTIREIYVMLDEVRIGIEFDDFIGGHDLNGNAKEGHGWYVNSQKVQPLDELKKND